DPNEINKLSNPIILPTGRSQRVAFSPNNNYLAVAHENSPFVTIYKREGDSFTKVPNPSQLPTYTGQGVAFSPSGDVLIVAHSSSPYITIYKIEGDSNRRSSNAT